MGLVEGTALKIRFLYSEDCPSHGEALQRLQEAWKPKGISAHIEILRVDTDEDAEKLKYVGSPTIIVNGRDIDPPETPHYAVTCRAYRVEDGRVSPLPSEPMIEKRFARPKRRSHKRARNPHWRSIDVGAWNEAMSHLKIGNEAVAFKLSGVDGKEHSFDEYKDKNAVVVIFSCNHCPICPSVGRSHGPDTGGLREQGVQLIAINANDASKYPDDSFPNMKERASVKKFNFPYLRDEAQSVARAYGAERTPEVFLFNKNGILRYHGTIDDNYDDPKAVKQHYLYGPRRCACGKLSLDR